MEQLSRIDTAPLFSGHHAQLMAVLRALDLGGLGSPYRRRILGESAVAEDSGWSVFCGKGPAPSARISLPAKEAWRVFFNAGSTEEVQSLASCSGDPDLVEAALQSRSVTA